MPEKLPDFRKLAYALRIVVGATIIALLLLQPVARPTTARLVFTFTTSVPGFGCANTWAFPPANFSGRCFLNSLALH